jgi:hypothetical protein
MANGKYCKILQNKTSHKDETTITSGSGFPSNATLV